MTRKRLIPQYAGFFRVIHNHKRVHVLSIVTFLVMIVFTQHVSYPYTLITVTTKTTTTTTTTSSNISQYDQFCLTLARKTLAEPALRIPQNITSRHQPLPYSYKHWKSSPALPRSITSCEHAIFIRLLSLLIEHAFVKHNISYMMMAGTLIGSYAFHDILPWDDDVDLGVFVTSRKRFQTIIRSKVFTSQSVKIIPGGKPNKPDKIFFTWCPHAGKHNWSFPFIDIFYHGENSTHIWELMVPSRSGIRREDVFPLVLRPLGPLWMLAPREPIPYFEARGMDKIGCCATPYSHRHERSVYKSTRYANCFDLTWFYPFVERQCSSTECVEYLRLSNTTLQTITLTPAYRSVFYQKPKKKSLKHRC